MTAPQMPSTVANRRRSVKVWVGRASEVAKTMAPPMP
jgi:hypothetical protein